MTLTIRKIIMLGIIGTILLINNILFVANWLTEHGVVNWAQNIRAEYLTGTALAVITVLLILLVSPRGAAVSLVRRCAVCDHFRCRLPAESVGPRHELLRAVPLTPGFCLCYNSTTTNGRDIWYWRGYLPLAKSLRSLYVAKLRVRPTELENPSSTIELRWHNLLRRPNS